MIPKLTKKIMTANAAYARGLPFLTDTEYDSLWAKLYDLDPTNKVLYHTTNDPNLPGDIYPHAHPIKGTQKAFSIEDLKPFLTRFGHTSLLLQPKYDGCAAVLYKGIDEHHDRLLLEGDGTKGRDVTHHLKDIFTGFEPRSIESVEVIVHNDGWTEEFGKNVRSTVAGWLARAKLPNHKLVELVSHNNGEFVEEYLFDGNYDALLDKLLSLYALWSTSYKIDGIMLKVADEKLRLTSGDNGTAYNWSIAWKPPIQTAETTVVDIEWNVSRTGRVVPTVIYEPITLCGTLCTRATGNNAQWLADKALDIKDTIIIGKAGEIIPKIISVKSSCAHYTPFLSHCPICNTKLILEGKDLVCTGPFCIAQLTKSLSYFYSDKGMEVKTIGEFMIADILQDPHVRSVLSEKPWALLDPITFGIYNNIMAIWKAKRTFNYMASLADIKGTKHAGHFISALGLPGLAYKTTLKLLHFVQHGESNSHISQIAKDNFIYGLGKFYLNEPLFQNFNFIPVPHPPKLTYCITGTLTSSRSDMITYLEKYSWSFSNQVSKFTDILIVGESPGRTKTTKAKELNIITIKEDELSTYLKE